jgi:hypothetical protein
LPAAHAQGVVVLQPYWSFETEARVTTVDAADLDGDGLPEIAVGTADSQLYILQNDGDLTWRYEAGGAISAVVLADLDGDGQAEVVVGSADGAVSLLDDAGQPAWTFRAAGTATIGMEWVALPCLTTCDLDQDGESELLVGSYDGQVYALDGDGSAALTKSGHTRWSFELGRPILGIWTGDVDGDGQLEVIPSPYRGGDLYWLENDGHLAWHQRTEGEIGQVQGGDVDGDGQAEVVLLTASWDLFVYRGDGTLAWHSKAMALSHAHATPVPGQLLVRDLDGDGRAEIAAVTIDPPITVYVFQGDGSQAWTYLLDTSSIAARLAAHDVDGDGDLEITVTTPVHAPVYLLDSGGRLLAEYHTWGTSGSLELADLDGDGRHEILVATEIGLQVFGTSDQAERRQLWRSPSLGPVAELALGDLDGDGRGEVVAGTQDGRVYSLADRGQLAWDVPLQTGIVALDAGDVDGDGRDEVAVGTWGGAEGAGGQIHLLDSGRRLWSKPAGLFVTDIAAGNDQVIAAIGSASGGAIVRFDGKGSQVWQREFDERVTAVSSHRGLVFTGTQDGQVHQLAIDGLPMREYDLGSTVLSVGDGLAVTTDGRFYHLGGDALTLRRELGESPTAVHLDTTGLTYASPGGRITNLTEDDSSWQWTVDGEVTALAASDLNSDGLIEIAVGTSRGRVYLFGLAINQPPLLTGPGLAETRTGYAYSVDVDDPEQDAVTVTLEVWDPSAERWLVQPSQTLAGGIGRLSWDVQNPFDTWDARRDSRYRFAFDDGQNHGTAAAVPGPLAIPVAPWYVHLGRYAGGLVLVALLVSPLAFYARRTRAYRRSPIGQGEATLRRLTREREMLLPELHRLMDDKDWVTTVLPHLPGLSRDAAESILADLAEGYYLILTRPDVLVEGLRLILAALARADGLAWVRETQNLYELALEALQANSVPGVVALRGRLGSLGAIVVHPDFFLANATRALAGLRQVSEMLRNFERVETSEDRIAYLAEAIESLGRHERQVGPTLASPERTILVHITGIWLGVITNTLHELQGQAQVQVILKTRQVVASGDAALTLELQNVGRSPASNLRVQIVPARGYGVIQGSVTVDQLPARSAAEAKVSVRPTVQDEFRAEFEIRYDDREQAGKVQRFADLVRLVPVPQEFIHIPSPYATGRPLAPGSPVFFGREDLFGFIRENLGGSGRENILVLIGQRRMGKTSLLHQLPAQLSDNYIPLFLDGQALGIEGGMAGLFFDIALEICETLHGQGIALEPPTLGDLEEKLSLAFEKRFLVEVTHALGERVLVLLFDEFEELEMRVRGGELPATVFPYLRHLMQHSQKLAFVFAGTHRLEELTADYWSILFNIALYKQLSFLSFDEGRRLIVEPVQDFGLLYDDLAIDKMLRVTGGHPYFLQLLCHTLVNLHNRERRNYLTIQDVNRTLDEIVRLGEAHLSFLWSESSREERAVLVALSRLLAAGEPATTGEIASLLREFGVRLDPMEASDIAKGLIRRDILRHAGVEAERFEFTVDLIRLWIGANQPLSHVVSRMT